MAYGKHKKTAPATWDSPDYAINSPDWNDDHTITLEADENFVTDAELTAIGTISGKLDSVIAGTNITIDNTDPANPVISATGGGATNHNDLLNIDGGTVGEYYHLTAAEYCKVGYSTAWYTGAIDPTAAAPSAAIVGDFYLKSDGSFWEKTDVVDPAWTLQAVNLHKAYLPIDNKQNVDLVVQSGFVLGNNSNNQIDPSFTGGQNYVTVLLDNVDNTVLNISCDSMQKGVPYYISSISTGTTIFTPNAAAATPETINGLTTLTLPAGQWVMLIAAEDTSPKSFCYIAASSDHTLVYGYGALAEATGDVTGFVNSSNITREYDSVTRTVTFTAISGTLDYYWRGRKNTLGTTWTSSAHTDAAGNYFLSTTDGINFTWSTTPWLFTDMMVAFISYGATDKFGINEAHGLMDSLVHEEAHDTIGCYKKSGGAFSNYVLASTTAADRRPDISQTTIKDEDLPTVLAALTSETYTQFSLTGAATPVFTKAAADIIALSTDRPYYNQLSGGTYAQTLMTANAYTCVWVVAVPVMDDAGSQAYRYIFVQGQAAGTLAQMQALNSNSVSMGALSNLATEFTFIGKITLQYVAANWELTSVEALSGSNKSQTATAGSANVASAIAVDATGFNGNLATTDDDLQKVAQKVDDLVLGGGMTNPMTTAGDIIVGGTSGVPARLAMGSALQGLRVNAGATGLEYAAITGGAVDYTTAVSITSASSTPLVGRLNLVSGTTGDYTVGNFPSAASNSGKVMHFKIAAYASANKLYTINSKVYWAEESVVLWSDGSSWLIVDEKLIPFQARADVDSGTTYLFNNATATRLDLITVGYRSVVSMINTTAGQGKIVIPRTGTYDITPFIFWYSNHSANTKVENRVYKNGAAFDPTVSGSIFSGVGGSILASYPLALVAGDGLEMYGFYDAGTYTTRCLYSSPYSGLMVTEVV